MKILEKKQLINEAITRRGICNIYFKYDNNYFNLIPLLAEDKLFLSAKEDDFIMNGYTVRRFDDIVKVSHKNNKCNEILIKEQIEINIPKVNITNWQTVFNDLQKASRNIIIESESLNPHKYYFFIGKIEEVAEEFLLFKHFDAAGIWEEEPYKIMYNKITSVSFDTRYVNIFSKYI